MKKGQKALVIDDSALVRRFLKKELERLGFEVEVAKDGEEGEKKALANRYDFITLDIEMPRKSGLEVLESIMQENPTRVLVISAYVIENGEIAMRALELGALDYIKKPNSKVVTGEEGFIKELENKVRDSMKINKLSLLRRKNKPLRQPNSIEKPAKFLPNEDKKYVLIGASTGGPKLIEAIVRSLPATYPYPVCVVQHMPDTFTEKFAQRLNTISQNSVVEANNGEELTPGKIIIGKGGRHLHFRRDGSKIVCKLVPNFSNRFFVPSVDEMFLSALEVMNPKNIMAMLLTGIGDDGADGMVALKKSGAYTIAESEESATVYGMPKEAYVRGGAVKVLHFDEILQEIIAFGSSNGVKKSRS
ncbi:chemotaxis-specific protein-glutamate methyltransferase CheB [Nitratiruptor tergarcus]|uniref:Protein-glutamate methylesterase/protein-glutamine glutaminase n=1 Tax=Nitratiruptor tergarcus DSM 16512 TaxID=1069081 RepID=A0A1W1WRN4_9BACT|nr:chemotaxis-specific protein-glutamate methyltransferase CheB [Nitratiruptor tergarcus]SMC08964.1 two-component system, chemotaxis family, response regulator CheB [Nitratiruptor tergarcus DSM 16512]